jgi:hypothetical protein
MFRILVLSMSIVSLAYSADVVSGTWKLNTAKSKYTGVPMPKDMTVTYTPQAGGWRYEARGTSATGEAINSRFTYSKDGEDSPTTGFPNWDSISLKGGNSNKSVATLKREGKPVGTATRTISADGKAMTIRANVTLPDGKKATYVSVYDKQ